MPPSGVSVQRIKSLSVTTVRNNFLLMQCLPQSLGQTTVTESLLQNSHGKLWMKGSFLLETVIISHQSHQPAPCRPPRLEPTEVPWSSATLEPLQVVPRPTSHKPHKTEVHWKQKKSVQTPWIEVMYGNLYTNPPKKYMFSWLLHIFFPTWRPHALCKPWKLLD